MTEENKTTDEGLDLHLVYQKEAKELVEKTLSSANLKVEDESRNEDTVVLKCKQGTVKTEDEENNNQVIASSSDGTTSSHRDYAEENLKTKDEGNVDLPTFSSNDNTSSYREDIKTEQDEGDNQPTSSSNDDTTSSYRDYEQEARELVKRSLESASMKTTIEILANELGRTVIRQALESLRAEIKEREAPEWPTGQVFTIDKGREAIDKLVKVKDFSVLMLVIYKNYIL